MVTRFGNFELDSRRFQLTREGRVVKLVRIPLKLLFFLAESKGALVSREAIAEHLWGKDVFVDAQNSVNTAIRKLRSALRDDLADPKYIETVKGMGYRFVAEVDVCDPEDSAVEAQVGTFTPSNGNHQESVAAGSGDEAGEEIAEETAVITATDSPTNGTMRASLTPDRADLSGDHFPGDRFQVDRSAAASGTTEAEVTAAQGLKLWKIAVPVLLVALLAAGGLYYRTHRSKPLTDKDTIVLADFANSTGDPVFDDTLKTALNVSLRQSPFLNVLPGRQFTQTLKLMALPADAKLTPEQTRELCQRVGSKAYVAGSIASLGSQYVLGLKAVNCVSGDPLAEEQVTAASKEKVLDALGEAASKLRGELGESLATVQKYDVPLAQATTSSLEALKAYSKANDNSLPFRQELPYVQRAIELDPNFATAYLSEGMHYHNLGEFVRARLLYQSFPVAGACQRTRETGYRVQLLSECNWGTG